MKITGVRLRRFKRFTEWQTAFAPGLTVVRGPNEAGKTTLMEALLAGLFGQPMRGDAGSRLRTWGEQRLGEVTVEMQVNNERYLLRRDLEAGTILLQSHDGRERVDTPRDVQRRLLDWTGLASEGAYRSTAFVAQADLARVSEDRRLISGHLSKVLSGAGAESVQQALQWLNERRARLAGDAPGAERAADRLGELQAEQAAIRAREERGQRHRLELRAVIGRLEDIEREAAERTEIVRVARQASELQQRERALLDEQSTAQEHLTKTEGLLARLAKLDASLGEVSAQQEAAIADLFHARRQYLQLESALSTTRDQTEREERALERLATRHHTASRAGGVGWALLGGGAIAAIAGVLIVTLSRLPLPGATLAAAGVVLLLIGLRRRGRITGAGTDYRSQEQRVLELRRRVDVLQREVTEAEAMTTARLQAAGNVSLDDVERRYSSYVELLREREEVRAGLRQIRGDDPRSALQDRLREIGAELGRVQAAIQALPRTARGGVVEGTERLEREARTLAAESQELREKRARLEGVLEELRDRGDEGPRIDEEIAGLQAEAARSQRLIEVIDLTIRMLQEARTLSVYPARELLERRASEYLGLATDGAYTKVALDEQTLRPQVWVSSIGSWKDAMDLSQATSDQLYLALRLGLLDVISGDRRPPLFLDEPFAHLDADRRRAMAAVLAAAARERQVVLFTCWPDYDALADRVIVLDQVARAAS